MTATTLERLTPEEHMSALQIAQDLHRVVNPTFGAWEDMPDDYRQQVVAQVEAMSPRHRDFTATMMRALGAPLSPTPESGE